MNQVKTIAVVGATGAQGGGLARAILADREGGYRLRAITRNVDSDKARALGDAGAELVSANLDDEASLVDALKGVDSAFFVTNFWEHFSPEKELAQAGNLARAAKAAGVKHVVWSTLEDTRKRVPLDDDRMPTLQGKYKVPHFDAKGEADALFAQAGVPTTYLLTSFYWDNLVHFGMGPKPGPDGTLQFVLPMDDAKMPAIAAEDIGQVAYAILKDRDAYVGKTVAIAGEHLNGREMASALSDALGREVKHAAVSPAEFRSYGFPGADDLGHMFQYYRDFEDEFRAKRDVDATRRLHPKLQSFSEWLGKNAALIPLA